MTENTTPAERRRINALLGLCLCVAIFGLVIAMGIALFKYAPRLRAARDYKAPVAMILPDGQIHHTPCTTHLSR